MTIEEPWECFRRTLYILDRVVDGSRLLQFENEPVKRLEVEGPQMGFEVFEKASAPITTVPSVTIQKRGMVSLNSAAHQMMGEPEAVTFLWDAQRRVIGLKACDISDPNAYPTRPTGPTQTREPDGKQTRAKRGKAVLVAGSMFTQYIGLDTSEARRWVPQLEGDVLIVDLNSESQRVVSNRNKAREAAVAREGAAT